LAFSLKPWGTRTHGWPVRLVMAVFRVATGSECFEARAPQSVPTYSLRHRAKFGFREGHGVVVKVPEGRGGQPQALPKPPEVPPSPRGDVFIQRGGGGLSQQRNPPQRLWRLPLPRGDYKRRTVRRRTSGNRHAERAVRLTVWVGDFTRSKINDLELGDLSPRAGRGRGFRTGPRTQGSACAPPWATNISPLAGLGQNGQPF
jgi:hypothetical protein